MLLDMLMDYWILHLIYVNFYVYVVMRHCLKQYKLLMKSVDAQHSELKEEVNIKAKLEKVLRKHFICNIVLSI